jgi:predicted subunit of tRNA(5-methylaminomethyl-2-thiouridylate) methyltransferase
MDVGVLSSGGKDSTLAALILEQFCSVTLLCGTFGVTDDHEHAQAAATAVGLPARRIDLDGDVAEAAVDQMLADGFPRNGIQQVHEHALEVAADREFDAIADGTRRDDRVPTVDRSLAQSIEDRYGVSYLAPLAGIGSAAVDELTAETLVVERGPSAQVPKGDYEAELRALITQRRGRDAVDELFPEHVQSRVVGRRE